MPTDPIDPTATVPQLPSVDEVVQSLQESVKKSTEQFIGTKLTEIQCGRIQKEVSEAVTLIEDQYDRIQREYQLKDPIAYAEDQKFLSMVRQAEEGRETEQEGVRLPYHFEGDEGEQTFVVHRGTGTIILASECELVRIPSHYYTDRIEDFEDAGCEFVQLLDLISEARPARKPRT